VSNDRRARALALMALELERLRAMTPHALEALATASPHEAQRRDLAVTTSVDAEDGRLMVLVEVWRGRRTLATGGFAMAPDGSTRTPD